MRPVPLAAKTVEERPLLVDMQEAKKDASRRQREMLKEGEEKENRVLRKEEKENRVGRKEEQASHSWRRSVAVAPRK